MKNPVLLNNIDHGGIRVAHRFGAAFGDAVTMAPVFPAEIADIQRVYPILFRKTQRGTLQPVALLGLDEGENLFLEDSEWTADPVPAIHQRGPFAIGLQSQERDGQSVEEPVIFVDLADERISETEGFPLFLKHGGNAPYLEQVSRNLRTVYLGEHQLPRMIEAFQHEHLFENARLDLQLDAHTTYKISDMSIVSEQKLSSLSGEALDRLNRTGVLGLAFMIAASLSNIQRLIALKNARRGAAGQ